MSLSDKDALAALVAAFVVAIIGLTLFLGPKRLSSKVTLTAIVTAFVAMVGVGLVLFLVPAPEAVAASPSTSRVKVVESGQTSSGHSYLLLDVEGHRVFILNPNSYGASAVSF